MRAISIRQPWASLIADGKKTIELRTWSTSYRGPLLICASAKPHGNLPVGVAICVVDLVDIRPATAADARAAQCEPSPRSLAWILSSPRTLPEPFPVRGKLSLFAVEDARLNSFLASTASANG